MATLGLVLFDFAAGLLASALNMGLALLIAAIWPRVRVAWRPALGAWLVNAVGLTLQFTVVDTWFLGADPSRVPMAYLADTAIALATAAVVSFGVLRLRRMQGWVFFLLLTILAIPLRITVTRM